MHEAIMKIFVLTKIIRSLSDVFYSKIKTKKNDDSMFNNIQFFCSERRKQTVGLNLKKKKKIHRTTVS